MRATITFSFNQGQHIDLCHGNNHWEQMEITDFDIDIENDEITIVLLDQNGAQ